MFQKLRQNKINKIIENVDKKDLTQRYSCLMLGCLIVAFAFNIFFSQYDIVCFGVSGLSIVFKKFGIPTHIFILCVNIILLIVSYFALGPKKTKNAIVGSLLFPVFTWLTSFLVPYIHFDNVEKVVIAIFGGVISGLGYGLIFKTNFNTGGTDIITEIVSKYTKISIGKAQWMSDGMVVLSAKIAFNWETVLYGFVVLYIISFMTDKVILGISQSKAFYIVSEKEEEIKKFLLDINNGGVTVINARGGYSNSKQTLLLGVVPTRQYYLVKEAIQEIDEKVFFLVCDAYEVSNRSSR